MRVTVKVEDVQLGDGIQLRKVIDVYYRSNTLASTSIKSNKGLVMLVLDDNITYAYPVGEEITVSRKPSSDD